MNLGRQFLRPSSSCTLSLFSYRIRKGALFWEFVKRCRFFGDMWSDCWLKLCDLIDRHVEMAKYNVRYLLQSRCVRLSPQDGKCRSRSEDIQRKTQKTGNHVFVSTATVHSVAWRNGNDWVRLLGCDSTWHISDSGLVLQCCLLKGLQFSYWSLFFLILRLQVCQRIFLSTMYDYYPIRNCRE